VNKQFTQNSPLANGTVASQSPNAGAHVTPNTPITLYVVKNAPPPSPTPSPTPSPSPPPSQSPTPPA
jgi:beta-lactam-binding protein with PASTA domain